MTKTGDLALSLAVGLRVLRIGTTGLGHRRVQPGREHSAEDKGPEEIEGSETIARCVCWLGKLDRGDAITREDEGTSRAIIPALEVHSAESDEEERLREEGG